MPLPVLPVLASPLVSVLTPIPVAFLWIRARSRFKSLCFGEVCRFALSVRSQPGSRPSWGAPTGARSTRRR